MRVWKGLITCVPLIVLAVSGGGAGVAGGSKVAEEGGWVWREGLTRSLDLHCKRISADYFVDDSLGRRDNSGWECAWTLRLDVSCHRVTAAGVTCGVALTVNACVIRDATRKKDWVRFDRGQWSSRGKAVNAVDTRLHALQGKRFELRLSPEGRPVACDGLETVYREILAGGAHGGAEAVLRDEGRRLLSSTTFRELLNLLMDPLMRDWKTAWWQPVGLSHFWGICSHAEYPLAYVPDADAENAATPAERVIRASLETDPRIIERQTQIRVRPLRDGEVLTGTACFRYDPATSAPQSHTVQLIFCRKFQPSPG